MSADCWRNCPRCAHNAAVDKELKTKWLSNAYGHISREDWLAAETEIAALPDIDPYEIETKHSTFRENYEFTMRNGEVIAYYVGWCTECGYKLKFEHHEPLPPFV